MIQNRMRTIGLAAGSTSNGGQSDRLARFVLTLVIAELTIATAYIHLGLGGPVFTANGVGYLGLAAAYVATAAVPIAFLKRFAWLARLGLVGYTALTIGAYLVVGPYFLLGWITKGIEVAIVGLVIVDMLSASGGVRGLSRQRSARSGRDESSGVMRDASVHRAGMIALVALAVIVAACGSSSAGSNPPLEPTDADVTITSRDLAFDRESLTIEAQSASRLRLVNDDAAPHNVAIYSDESATDGLFIGELITATSIVYEVPAMEPGIYYFRCDLHPEMDGTLTVQG